MTTAHRTAVTVIRNEDRRRYEASAGTAVAGFVDYQETSELVVLTHTEVVASFESRGVGSALAQAALDDVRERRLKALVICPFILGWLRRPPRIRRRPLQRAPAKVGDDVPS
jgi:predicted GNAT family acetyltransferase